MNFSSLEQFSVHSHTEGQVQRFPVPPPPPYAQLPRHQHPPDGTFVTAGEPALTRPHGPVQSPP